MRQAFPGYYELTEAELKVLWNDGLIVPDANVLLGLYRYSPTARETLLKLFGYYQTRLWIPHQAGMEFHRRRLEEIFSQRARYEALSKGLKGILEELDSPNAIPLSVARFERVSARRSEI